MSKTCVRFSRSLHKKTLIQYESKFELRMTHDIARYYLNLLITLYKGTVPDSITVSGGGGGVGEPHF